MRLKTTWNKGAERFKGYKAEEVIGKNFEIFYTPQDQLALLPQILNEKAVQQSKITNEGWRVKKDGTRFWRSVLIRPYMTAPILNRSDADRAATSGYSNYAT